MQDVSVENRVTVALRRISRAIDVHSRALLQRYGMTAPQLAALKAVGELQPVAVSGVAGSMHLSLATVTGILSRLEARELVNRSRNEQDRRTVVVELTQTGAKLLRSAPSLLHDRFRRELANMKQRERSQLLASLERIAAMMDMDGIEAAPALSTGMLIVLPEDTVRCRDKTLQPTNQTRDDALGRSDKNLSELK